MAQTDSESVGTNQQNTEKTPDAINRQLILDRYFQELKQRIPSFLEQQNQKHRLVQNDERQDTTLINIPARIPTEFIDKIQSYLDRHLANARDVDEFIELVHQTSDIIFLLLDIFIQEWRTVLDEMSKNNEVPYLQDDNFSFPSDLKEFLTEGPHLLFKGPLHVLTLRSLYMNYHDIARQTPSLVEDTATKSHKLIPTK